MPLFRSPPWRSQVYWALDLETSGLDAKADAILSVGMLPVRDGLIRWGERFYSLVQPPGGHIPPLEALRIHHILPEEAAGAPPLREVLEEIDRRLAGGVLLVHYGRLDIGFLRVAHRVKGMRWRRPMVVDTVKLLGKLSHRRRLLDPHSQPLSADLAKARRELGLPRHVHHHALYDALATAELFLALREQLEARTLRHLK